MIMAVYKHVLAYIFSGVCKQIKVTYTCKLTNFFASHSICIVAAMYVFICHFVAILVCVVKVHVHKLLERCSDRCLV